MTDEPMSDLQFDHDGLSQAANLVMDYKYETINGVEWRRLYAVDPDCAQDGAFCPCGPVGKWERLP